jgi:tetratricopeptide (TPR) repeat protein
MVSKPAPVPTFAGAVAVLAATAAGALMLAEHPLQLAARVLGTPSAHAHGAHHHSDAPGNASPRAPEASRDPLAFILSGRAGGTDPLDTRIAAERNAIRSKGATPDGLEKLGWSFVEKARVSADHDYYVLARHAARAMRTLETDSSAADLLEGHALHSLHRFEEAESIARRLAERRGSPLDHALLGDTLLDQGRIDEAVAAYQKMMHRRPDSRAYSRVAEVRLLTGDLDGALEAMRVASRAVSVRDREAFAWIWSRLAMLELQRGNLAEARAASDAAVSAAPGLAIAELSRGRVLLAAGDAAGAVAALERSIATSPLPDAIRALADAYAAAGRDSDAARTTAELEAGGASVDPRGYSLWLAETGRDAARALRLATAELDRRRDVYTWDALAMASAAAGKVDDARRFMQDALAAGTEDPRLWYHAGVVAAASGNHEEARAWFERARGSEQVLLPSLRRDLSARLDASARAVAARSRADAPATGSAVTRRDLPSTEAPRS